MSQYFKRGEKSILPTVVIKDTQQAPSPDEPVRMGRVEIDNDLCNGCKLCVMVCLVKSLEMTGKKSVGMIGDSALCIAFGDSVPVVWGSIRALASHAGCTLLVTEMRSKL